jgi:hypothetical protein
VGEDRTGRQSGHLVTVDEAARHLGLTVDAVRKRVQRRQIAYEKDEAGRVRIILDKSETLQDKSPDTTGPMAHDTLVDRLREEVAYLRGVIAKRDEELSRRDEELRRRDAALEREQQLTAMFAERLGELEGSSSERTEDKRQASNEPPPNLVWLAAFAPLGPSAAAILFAVSVWGPDLGQSWWLYVSYAFALLPAVIGFIVGRNRVQLLRIARARQERGESRENELVEDWLSEIGVAMIPGSIVALGTAAITSGVIKLLEPLFREYIYDYRTFFLVIVLGAFVSAVFAALLWASAALFGMAWERQGTLGQAGGRGGRINAQTIVPFVGTVLTAVLGLIGTVWAAQITGG